MDEDKKSTEELFAEMLTEVEVLRSENSKLKKRLQELEHIRQLNLAEIVGLRRQMEWMEVEHGL